MRHHSCSSSFPPSSEAVPGFAALCAVGCGMRIFKDSAEADSNACRHVSPHCNRHYHQFLRPSGPRGSGPSHRSTCVELTPGHALWRDADSHGELFGHLRRCCLGTSQDEDRLRIGCCAPGVMAANCNHDPNRRADFSQELTSKQQWLTGLTAGGGCAVEGQSLDRPPATILSSIPKCVLRP